MRAGEAGGGDRAAGIGAPFASLHLQLGPRRRRGTSSALRGTTIGRVTFQGWQIDPLVTDPGRYPKARTYLVQVNYDVELDPRSEPAAWLDVGLTFRCDRAEDDVVVVDLLPRHVDVVTDHASFTVSEHLGFAATGGPAEHGAVADLPPCRPVIESFGAASATALWRHLPPTGERLRSGSHRAWITMLVPSWCPVVFVRAHADFDCPVVTSGRVLEALQATDGEVAVALPTTSPLPVSGHPRRRGGTVATPPDVAWTDTRTRLGFTVDVEGFSSRSVPQKDELQVRLDDLVREAVGAAGVDPQHAVIQAGGDLMNVFLPDVDQSVALPAFLHAVRDGLRRDNQRFRDRMRLRLAADIGPVGPARLGFSGEAILSVYRLAHAPAARRWLVENPTVDLAAVLSDRVYGDFVAPRYPGLDPGEFRREEVEEKTFRGRAWLWVAEAPAP